jgi:hypothetical protein
MEVCGRYHQIPFAKMLTFYRKEPFTLEARYSGEDTYPANPVIGNFSDCFIIWYTLIKLCAELALDSFGKGEIICKLLTSCTA